MRAAIGALAAALAPTLSLRRCRVWISIPRDGRALPDAREFAWLGAMRFALGEGRDPAELSPLYLRDKVALTEAERRAAPAS